MSESKTPVGTIAWIDLTVENATEVRDFYRDVVGWESSDVPMGEYSDYCMSPAGSGEPVTGICHALGNNAKIPPGWMVYITVEDVDKSAARCVSLGGAVIDGPRSYGEQGKYCVIRDPAGCVAALYSEN